MLSKDNLHNYQNRAATFMCDKSAAYLAQDCGLGKTPTTLTTINNLLSEDKARKVLVLGPPRVALHVWSDEVGKWDHIKQLRVLPVFGTPASRRKLLQQDAEVYTLSYDLLHWLVDLYKSRWPFDVVVCDEASMLKSYKSRRFKSLRKVRPYIKRIYMLSGTPAADSLMSLWPQYYLLDKGERLGRTFTGFRDRFYSSDYMGWNWTLRPGAEEQIHKAVSDISISMTAEDYLDLPEMITNEVFIYLPPKVMTQYRELEKEFLITLEKGADILAPNSAALTNKLRQVSNGAVYDEEHNWTELHDEKLHALEEIIGESGSVLVFYEYKFDQERIKKKFPHAIDVRDNGAIEKWNLGEARLLMGHFASMSHGLNLQDGGHTAVFFNLPWSGELYQQAVARLHRQGQQHSVIIHHLLALDTVEARVSKVLQEKRSIQDALLEALKDV